MAVDVTAFSALARSEFMQGKIAAEERVLPAEFDSFTTKMPSTTRVETHTYMSELPRLYEFKGYTPRTPLVSKPYTVENKEYRIGEVIVRKTDLDDDQVGGYLRQINAIPALGQADIGRKVLDHLADGTSNLCFDGSAFFANSHTVGAGDNLDTYNAASNDGVTHKIIALRMDNPAIKPIVFQDRESLSELMTDAGTPQADREKVSGYWADCRFGLGYGYWWDGYHLTITDTPTIEELYTIIEQIINGMRTFTLPKGRDEDGSLYVHENWDPMSDNFVLLCNLKLGTRLRRAMNITQYVASTGNVDNVYQNVAKVIPTSALGA